MDDTRTRPNPSPADPGPVVATSEGRVRGLWRGESAAFLGIPFAQPPVGELRFLAPEPVPPWTGERDATVYGATAQRRTLSEVTAIPEPSIPGDSTLNVNVFTPHPGRPDAALPVLVWIHGGGYLAGSPASPWYDGAAFNRDGVVTVTLSYRLGLDGFGVIPDAPGNRGLLDQIEALRWVQRNIAAFGGDPTRVTIAGQSAGGGSVLALLHAPAAQGLFHAVISQSGALRWRSRTDGERAARQLAAALGIEYSLDGFRSVPEQSVVEATFALGQDPDSAPDAAGLVAAVARGDGVVPLPFPPVQDEATLPVPIADAAAAGIGGQVPLLLGATAHEFNAAAPMIAAVLGEADLSALLADTGLAEVAADYVQRHRDGTSAEVLAQLVTDTVFRASVMTMAQARAAGTTWVYDFRFVNPDTGQSGHCADLPFTFDALDAERVSDSCGPNPQQALAAAMHGAWVQFVHEHAAPWPAWSADTESVRVFGEGPPLQRGYEAEAALARALDRRVRVGERAVEESGELS